MPTGRINNNSRQMAVRVPLTYYGLMERDAKQMTRKKKKKCGISAVNNEIIEKHYEPELSKKKKSRKKGA